MVRRTLTTKNSTKAERVFAEILKESHIPFEHRVVIYGKEVDFLIGGNIAIEIDGHSQESKKNKILFEAGFVPIHITNKEILSNRNKIKLYVNELLR